MKKYLTPFLLFSIALILGAGAYKLLDGHLSKEILRLLLRVVLGLVFLGYTLIFIKDRKDLFSCSAISREQMILILLLAVVFIVNNYFLARSEGVDFMSNDSLSLVLVGFVVNSFYEEIAYRGFIQGYVNQFTETLKSPISQGNWLATILMTAAHLGFFAVMDVTFAITGLIVVFIFSLTVGYIRDKRGSIWLLVGIHTLMNGIHVLLNLEHYI